MLSEEEMLQDLRDKMNSSNMAIILFTKTYGTDFKSCIELGMAVILNKPLLLLVERGAIIGGMLENIAVAIEYYTDKSDMNEAVDRLIKKSLRGGS